MQKHLRTIAGPIFVLAILLGASWFLQHELQHYGLKDFLDGLTEIPPSHLGMAVALTVLNYAILIGYDILGVKYLGHSLHLAKVALGSFVGYVVGNNFGTLFGGSTIRYRLYSSWGLSTVEVVKLVLILGVTFWIGLFALAGFVFLWEPIDIPIQLHLPVSNTRPLGIMLAGMAVAYLAVCAVRREPIRIGRWEFAPPPLALSLMQYCVATLDLLVASAILYVLLPASLATSYWHFLATYLLALVAVFVTQVPGGLGVLELVILSLLNPAQPQELVGALLAYRAIYYLGPLVIGLLVLAVHEFWIHGKTARRALGVLGQWTPVIAPHVMVFTVFLAGVVLLFSGATPVAAGRMARVRHFLPLPVIEVSHFLGSVIGTLLLILARGLQRRIETAYYMTIALIIGGILTSLLKGFDYEEAIILSLMLAVFVPCRQHFYRKGALFTQRLTLQWIVAICGVLASTAWLMLFAFRHVDYQHQMWWQFEFSHDAPRSLRAIAAAAIVTLVALTARVLRSHGPVPAWPTEADMAEVRSIVAQAPKTSSHLALLGDKLFLFNKARTAFIMYGEAKHSLISMGDPVGPKEAAIELAWDFRELCDVAGRLPVFYQVDDDNVSTYVEMGLKLVKIGEEARVPLADFGLEGGARKNLRRTNKQLSEAGCSFEMIHPPAVSEFMPVLEEISEEWLSDKSGAEKGFSLGFFQPDYVEQTPIAIVRQAGRIVAFANLWLGAEKAELSLDLMRFTPAAPSGVMEFLFIRLMLWGQEEGYAWFNLGMAPLAGIEARRHGPLWNRLASLTFRHGEHFYNFQGLRQYKNKFDPVWTAKYVASPGGLSLAMTLADVTTLIAGGVGGLLKANTRSS